MATVSASMLSFSGIGSLVVTGAGCRKLPLQDHFHYKYRLSKFHYGTALLSRRNPSLQIPYFLHGRSGSACSLSAGRDYKMNYSNNSHTEPFWLNTIREAIWNTRSLLMFLAQQPSQLKYIEWPSFNSTLKTAILTLVIVALLIVALSSVDSALSYLLALLLRRKA